MTIKWKTINSISYKLSAIIGISISVGITKYLSLPKVHPNKILLCCCALNLVATTILIIIILASFIEDIITILFD